MVAAKGRRSPRVRWATSLKMRRPEISFGEFVEAFDAISQLSTNLELRIEKGVDSYFVGFRRRRTSIPVMRVAESGLLHKTTRRAAHFHTIEQPPSARRSETATRSPLGDPERL